MKPNWLDELKEGDYIMAIAATAGLANELIVTNWGKIIRQYQSTMLVQFCGIDVRIDKRKQEIMEGEFMSSFRLAKPTQEQLDIVLGNADKGEHAVRIK